MTMEKPHSDGNNIRQIKKLTLLDGFRVGIANLDNILNEVANLKLTDTQSIKTELIERTKTYNYVASGAENEYATALFQEYQRKCGKSSTAGDKIATSKPPGG